MRSILMILFFIVSVQVLDVQAQMSGAKSPMAQSSKPSNETVGKAEPNIWEVFLKRRSVRKFRSDAIPEGDITKIIDAARMAPTSGNQQPWKFLVIRDRKLIDRMIEACAQGSAKNFTPNGMNGTKEEFLEKRRKAFSEGYFSAPVFIVVLTDNNSKYPDYNYWDGPLAAGYLMLAARALGYGTVFVTDAIPESVTAEVLQIPDNYTRVCITPLGIPFEWPATPEKKKLEDFISYDKL